MGRRMEGFIRNAMQTLPPFSLTWSQSVRFRFFEAEIVHVFMFFERFIIRRCVSRRLPAATGAVCGKVDACLW